ncbi:MAG: hypothetical protein DHS20C14_20910 [Phycisphaeraceae bacterium]|nr:MAG: hypothetical protein DHS20C14_20910 [Phycisphaeraceae bacterium]
MNTRKTRLLAAAFLGITAANTAAAPDPVRIPDVDTSSSADGIVFLPTDTSLPILRVFQKTAVVRTHQGDPIHILVQRGVPPLSVRQLRSALQEVLAPVPGSTLGADKRAVAQALADKPAVLMIFRSQASVPQWRPGSLAGTKLSGMALLSDQVLLEGDPNAGEPGNPDEALAAAVRLTYEFGIADAMPDFAERMERATQDAIDRGVLDGSRLGELTIRQLAAIHLSTALEVSYGMWDGAPGAARGLYAPTTRAQLAELDPATADLINAFFAPHRIGERFVWPGFTGTYSLDPARVPAHRAWRSLIANLTLTGRLPVTIEGNALNNRFVGNVGDNTLVGLAGDDVLIGGEGLDRAVYRGGIAEYHIEIEGELVFVIDLAPDRDGSDVLKSVELLRFADAEIDTDPDR